MEGGRGRETEGGREREGEGGRGREREGEGGRERGERGGEGEDTTQGLLKRPNQVPGQRVRLSACLAICRE